MSLHTDHTPIQPQDRTIDQVLTALRDTPTPTGLEARIAQRLLQAQAAPAHPAAQPTFSTAHLVVARLTATKISAAKEFFAVILEPKAKDPRILLAAATALAVALAIPLTHLHHNQPNLANNTTTPTTNHPTATSNHPTATLSFRPERDGFIVPRSGETRSSRSPHITPAAQTLPIPTPDDPETIALAETLAPSQPIPTQPLTQQERLLLRLTRQGQPLEVAELELAREPFLRAVAVAHEHLTFAQVARSLLAPLAAAESLEPKPSSADAPPAASTELQPSFPR
jgi:hypothetical protein